MLLANTPSEKMVRVSTKNIVPYFLVFILLAPTAIKLEHRHSHNCSQEENSGGKSFVEKCFICDFQYSVFISSDTQNNSLISCWTDHFINRYKSSCYPDNSKFSFLLRAPPVLQSV